MADIGSLALVEPLRDISYCQSVLQGRDELYLLSGLESTFFPVATVTPEGIVIARTLNGRGEAA